MELFNYGYYGSKLREFPDKEKGPFEIRISKCLIACFSNCHRLTVVNLDNVDTSRLVSIRSLFSNCINLRQVSMVGWDVSCLRNCDFAFSMCINLDTIVIEWYNISENVNCFMTLYECSPKITSNTMFKFNINTDSPCPFY